MFCNIVEMDKSVFEMSPCYFFSYITSTFVIETMACMNALKRVGCRRKQNVCYHWFTDDSIDPWILYI